MNYEILISACLIILGWFVNSYLNRRHEIHKKRMEYRLEALKKHISFFEDLSKTKKFDHHRFSEVIIAFEIYGESDELALIEEIKGSIETDNSDPKWKEKIIEFNVLVKNKLRKELGLSG